MDGEQGTLANAGLVQKEPIENWPGVAHAYAARAKVHERQGDADKAVKDRRE